jgi:hypothetical protein
VLGERFISLGHWAHFFVGELAGALDVEGVGVPVGGFGTDTIWKFFEVAESPIDIRMFAVVSERFAISSSVFFVN